MTQQLTEYEHQLLHEVAREYRQRGYEVLVEPTSDQLPGFLANFRIDILARNREENAIVEVRTHNSLTSTPELDAIARALQDEPAWRFDLVVRNPREPLSLKFKDAVSLGQSDIVSRLHEARELSDEEHGEAALLLAWSATEALLRYIAENESIVVTAHNPNHVIKSLFIYGVLDREQYQILQEGVDARNRVIHGYKERKSLGNTVGQLLSVASRLQRQYQSSKSQIDRLTD